jgi:hypothetical protein
LFPASSEVGGLEGRCVTHGEDIVVVVVVVVVVAITIAVTITTITSLAI